MSYNPNTKLVNSQGRISQTALEEYFRAKEVIKLLETFCKERSVEIQKELEKGSLVQPGEFLPLVESRRSVPPWSQVAEQTLGKTKCDEIRAEQPKISYLMVKRTLGKEEEPESIHIEIGKSNLDLMRRVG